MRLPGQFKKDIESAEKLRDEFLKEKLENRFSYETPEYGEKLQNLQDKLDSEKPSAEMPQDRVDDIRTLMWDSPFTIEKIIFLHGSECPKDLYDALESGEIEKNTYSEELKAICKFYKKDLKQEFKKLSEELEQLGEDVSTPKVYDYEQGGGFVSYMSEIGARRINSELGFNGFIIKAKTSLPYDEKRKKLNNEFCWFYSPDFGMYILNEIAKWSLGCNSVYNVKKSNSFSGF